MAPAVKGNYNLRIREPQRKYNLRMREPVTEDVRHPDVSRTQRSMALEMAPEDAVKYLQEQEFETKYEEDGTFSVRKKGEASFKKVDPSRFELLHDVADVVPYFGEMAAAAPLTAKATVAGTAAFGPIGGAIAGGLAFGGQMAGMEALKQGGMKALGAPISLEGAASRVGEEFLYNTAGELGSRAAIGGAKAALGAARGLGKGIKTAAEQAAYSFDETAKAFGAAKAAGQDARGMLEARVASMGGDKAAMAGMTDDQLIQEFVNRQPGGALREKAIVEQSGKFIDERVGQDLDILTRRRGDKFSKVTGEKMASAGDLRRFPQARYGPYEGVKSLDEIKESFKGIPESDIRAFIQKEFGEARPIVVERAKILKSGARGKMTKYEVALQDMPRSELLDFMYKNQKGLVRGEAGTSRAKDIAHDMRDVVEINRPTFEMGNSWREVNLRGIQRMSDKAGKALDFTKPGMQGKLARALMGARGPLKRDLMGMAGQFLKGTGRALQAPVHAASKLTGGKHPLYTAGGIYAIPGGKAILGASVAGGIVEQIGKVLARDTGNLGSVLLSHADLPVRAARKIKTAMDALKARGVDSYRLAMQSLSHDPEFREWLESKA